MESRPENMKVSAGFDILMGGPNVTPPPPSSKPASDPIMNYQEVHIKNGTMNDGFDITGNGGPPMHLFGGMGSNGVLNPHPPSYGGGST